MSTQLTKYDAACRALSEAKNTDEVKDIRDKSIAMAAYARQAENKDLEMDAELIRARATRRLGEMIIEQKETVGMAKGSRGQLKGRDSSGGTKYAPPEKKLPTLAEAGISKKLSSEAQAMARVPLPEFQKAINEWKAEVTEAKRVATFGFNKKVGAHVANNSGNNEWYTPEKYIEIARSVMGSIDCDPASCDFANKTVKAKKYYTEKDNGLTHSWKGNVWMNPPYAQPLIMDFCSKVVSEINEGNTKEAMVLVNNGTETEWCQTLLSECSAACFISRRVKFVDKNGNENGAPLQGQCLFYFGSSVSEFTKKCSGVGVVLKK